MARRAGQSSRALDQLLDRSGGLAFHSQAPCPTLSIRKNEFFAGADGERCTKAALLIETCKLSVCARAIALGQTVR